MAGQSLDDYAKAFGIERPGQAKGEPAEAGGTAVEPPLEWPTAADPQAQRGICPSCRATKLEPRSQGAKLWSCLTLLVGYPLAAVALAAAGIGSNNPIAGVVMIGMIAVSSWQWRHQRRFLLCLSCAREIELG